ncbi:DUF3164 family protein (plasmid) [Ralstonia syzygii subsp. celebesensis]|uniref:DUF3164 family protein n=1 Tax=Ralstonia solanacearum species complex TaxID=3116862 RepID=UPI000B3BA264|nr:hypothetical protein RSSE_p0703 [Ralstonia solanacearum]QWF64274.1 DUF3164 family protein [Ralstonia solanacearum]
MENTIPAGYWRDGEGRLIPENMVKPIDRARDDVVRELVGKARSVSAVLAEFKAKAFGDIGAFVDMSAEQYGVTLGGKKGNVTLLSFDGRFKIVRQIQEHLVFDERLQAAKQLIDGCIQTWTEGSRDEIKALINDAFQVNKEGKINTARVLGLKRLNINDEKWLRAMQAIADSVQVAGSKPYVRIYERIGDSDQFKPIVLDLAAV